MLRCFARTMTERPGCRRSNGMELVAHLRLSKQALIDLVFFCGVPIVLAMLSAEYGLAFK